MIGVFDSGSGGLYTVAEFKKLMPNADICFHLDRKNAPYGTKDKETLIPLIKRNIDILMGAGASFILIACCTASTLWDFLPKEYKEISLPIIMPTAKRAVALTENGNIAVIATEYTVKSQAFSKAIKMVNKEINISEFAAQELVYLAEHRIYDKEKIKRILEPLKKSNADTLILGCTHFPILEKQIKEILPDMKTVNSAREGVIEMIKYTDGGMGKLLYADTKNEEGKEKWENTEEAELTMR